MADEHAMLLTSRTIVRPAFWFCAVLGLLAAVTPNPQALPHTGWDKSDHLAAFFVLGLLGLRGFANHRVVALGLLAYGFVIECVQAFLPYRSAEWRDVVADAIGILAAYGVCRLFEHYRRVRPSR